MVFIRKLQMNSENVTKTNEYVVINVKKQENKCDKSPVACWGHANEETVINAIGIS